MNLVFLGKQGSGKGTQAKIIAKKLNVCHISTGDLLRSATGELKAKIDEIINAGQLVSDDLIVALLKERTQAADCREGFILDGFPRNLSQAKILEENFTIDSFVEISISDKEVIERLVNRLNCKSCGAIFNKVTHPSKVEGVCDHCQGELYQRDDDNEEAISQRLEIYRNDTEPLVEYFGEKVLEINGSQPIDDVTEEILDKLSL